MEEVRPEFAVSKTKKDGFGSNVGGSGGGTGSEFIPLKFSSHSAAIVDTQFRLGGKVPATLTNVLDLA